MTIPVATPTAKMTPKIRVQNRAILWYSGFRVFSQRADMITRFRPSPMVRGGKRKWKPTVKANWMRERISTSIGRRGKQWVVREEETVPTNRHLHPLTAEGRAEVQGEKSEHPLI